MECFSKNWVILTLLGNCLICLASKETINSSNDIQFIKQSLLERHQQKKQWEKELDTLAEVDSENNKSLDLNSVDDVASRLPSEESLINEILDNSDIEKIALELGVPPDNPTLTASNDYTESEKKALDNLVKDSVSTKNSAIKKAKKPKKRSRQKNNFRSIGKGKIELHQPPKKHLP